MKKLLLLIPLFFSPFTYAVVCPAGEVDSGGVCVSACSILQGESRTYTYDSYIWGDAPTGFCFGSHSGGAACKMNATGTIISNIPSGSQYWSREFTFSGSECGFDEINRFSGDSPEPFPYEGDVNQNGVNDDFEDWDGDGINNGEDPDPYNATAGVPDENGDGIPDDIEGIYDELTHTQEILYCNNDDDQCHQMRYAMRDLTKSNQILASAMRDASLRNVRRTDYRESMGTLVSTVNANDRAILDALNNIDVSSADNSAEISQLKSFLNSRISDTSFTNYQKIKENNDLLESVDRRTQAISRNVLDNYSKIDDVDEKTDVIYARSADILNKLNQSNGGLTADQQRQLKNAAKSWNNPKNFKKLFKANGEIKDKLNKQLQATNNVESQIKIINDALADVAAQTAAKTAAALDPKFTQLSDQIAAISTDGLEVDLSSVEDGIAELGEKIDGLENGSDASPSGSCSTSFVCTGNTYDCYLAQQAFETKCAIGNQRDLFGDVFETALGSTNGQSYLDTANGELERSLNSLYEGIETTATAAGDGELLYSEDTDITQYLDTYNQENGGLDFNNDECPKPIELNFVLAGVKQMDMELSLEWLCELALYVRAMLMLGASMIAGRLWFQNY